MGPWVQRIMGTDRSYIPKFEIRNVYMPKFGLPLIQQTATTLGRMVISW